MIIAVIGHGRSPENKRWGKRIDRCETVVRMWNHDWQASTDYGRKYDYGIMEILGGDFANVFWRTPKRTPSICFVAYERDKTPSFRLPPGTLIIDQRYRDEARRMGARGGCGEALNLTRGGAAACWAIAELARAGDEVVLVGFDNMVAQRCLPTDDAFSPEYLAEYDKLYPRWRNGWYTPGLTTCGTHDIAIELPLVQALAKRRDIRLQFAQEIWA